MDPEVSDQEKEAVAQKIQAQEATESEGQGKVYEKTKIDHIISSEGERQCLSDFVWHKLNYMKSNNNS